MAARSVEKRPQLEYSPTEYSFNLDEEPFEKKKSPEPALIAAAGLWSIPVLVAVTASALAMNAFTRAA